MDQPKDRKLWRWVALAIIIGVIALGLAVVFLGSTRDDAAPAAGDPAVSPTPTPAAVPSPSQSGIALPDLKGIPKRGLYLLVVAEDGACWSGFLGSQQIEECGHQAIRIAGNPVLVSANGRLNAPAKGSFELYVVEDGVGLAAARTRGFSKPISVTVNR
ncbi:MAG: hypothetical protein M3N53_09875 [Actinomycetota bacterium]|nr:hypothetical protein [Actinomycetota bacterium]